VVLLFEGWAWDYKLLTVKKACDETSRSFGSGRILWVDDLGERKYKILSNILLSRLSPYIDEIIG
jgi:hypothetical protein